MPTLAYPLGFGNTIITGGTIDGATIGATTPAAGTFTTLTATGNVAVGGAAAGSTASEVTVANGAQAQQNATINGVSTIGMLNNGTVSAVAGIPAGAAGVRTTTGPVYFSPAGGGGMAATATGLGYVTGAGGAQTQGAGSGKATGVTLAKMSGAITMNNAALLAGAKVSFAVSNSMVVATDSVIVSVASGGTANAYRANVTAVGASTFTVTVENITAGSLSEAPVINFAVIKGVSA